MSAIKLNGDRKVALKTETEVSADVVQLALRSRFNPLRQLTPAALSSQLDNFNIGLIAYAALTWEAIEKRDDVLKGVAAKRKKNVAKLKRESLQREESPEAEAHAEALDEFYDNLSVINALDENEAGGFSLLVRQMMDAVGKYYAVHEIVWQPGEDGVLTAEMRFVPLWFFENRTGRLQFLRIPLGGAMGTPLEEGGWMITKGDGLMEACSVAYMFKNLPLKDWLAYSDKFGTPGVLGQTNAAQGSDAGNAMKSAVASFGQNWSGVVYGADGAIKEPLSLITAQGEGTLPFPPLIERMDRAMVALWRGSDLSTMSADTKGASVQDGESDILLSDDAEMISDTLNLYVDRFVIAQKFGTGTKPLAYSKLIVPQKEGSALDVAIDTFLLQAGAQLGANERLEHYGRPKLDEKDTPLKAPAGAAPMQDGTAKGTKGAKDELANQSPVTSHQSHSSGADSPQLGRLLAKARDFFPAALAKDLQPLRTALARVLHGDDDGLPARAQALANALPVLGAQIISAHASSEALYQILSAAAASGLATQQAEPLANVGDLPGHEFRGNQYTQGSPGNSESDKSPGMKTIEQLRAEFPSVNKACIEPTPELAGKISTAFQEAEKNFDSAVGKFAASEKTSADYDRFTGEVAAAKARFKKNSDKETSFEVRVEHSTGGYGRDFSESTYVDYDVIRRSDAESYFGTPTVRYSRHGRDAREVK